ncbi:pyridoxal-dependent decarboxylase [Allokutzneria oryzae]|uniref:glutamate decarboxylase n=1 Tax=Allokutzneria oryzae TaxID=1378989 RepID=A0ABV6A8Y3_9PSEU
MSANVQVCWEKFASYRDVEAHPVPMRGEVCHLTAEEATRRCDENTIGVVAVLGSTFDGSCAALDRGQREQGWDIPVRVDGASAPFCDPELEWDFTLPRVASTNTSGHEWAVPPRPRVGAVARRRRPARRTGLRGHLPGGQMPTFALTFSRPGAQVAAQYHNFLRLGRDGYRRVQQYCRYVARALAALGPFRLITDGRQLPVFAFTLADSEERYSVFDVSAALRERGWLVPGRPAAR